jgi:hypothetical protein
MTTKMKVLLILALVMVPTHIQSFTPLIHKAMCAKQQVCQTCYRTDPFGNVTAYQCNCHTECLPGT